MNFEVYTLQEQVRAAETEVMCLREELIILKQEKEALQRLVDTICETVEQTRNRT